MLLASRLYGGVDVWLNNPRAPLEASGTSGMKAAANGALNLSVLDGWWIEGFAANPDTGWGIEPSEQMDGKGTQPTATPSMRSSSARSCRFSTSAMSRTCPASGFAGRKRRSARWRPASRHSGW